LLQGPQYYCRMQERERSEVSTTGPKARKCAYICGRLSHMLLLLVSRLHVMCSDNNNINSVGVEKSGRIKTGLAFPHICMSKILESSINSLFPSQLIAPLYISMPRDMLKYWRTTRISKQ
ncbi:Hypothetical predicted protein, partial [Paramuricea clavata]